MKSKQNDIFLYVKSLFWIITPFCLLGSLHYLFVFFPRVLKNEDSVLELNHLNFDYLGVIVGFFTLLVTLLVGWNIYSTIKAKEEIEGIKKVVNTESNKIRTQTKNFVVSEIKNASLKMQDTVLSAVFCPNGLNPLQ